MISVIKLEYRLLWVYNLLNRITCIMAHKEFELQCVPSHFSMKITNMPWTAKVLGSNLDQDLFFSNVKYSVSKKIFGQLFVFLSVAGLAATSWNSFFDVRFFFLLCCSYFLLCCSKLQKKFLCPNCFGLFFIGFMT